MTSKDLEAFQEIMTALNEVYGDPNKPVNDIKMRLYFKALEPLSIEELNKAVGVLLRTKTFRVLPTPGEILEAAHGGVDDRAAIAFESVINNANYYASVIFEDGTIGKVIEAMGGWDAVNEWKEDDRKWNRAEFIKLYKIYDARGPWPVKKFIGAIEAHNRQRFPELVPPTVSVPDANRPALPARKKELKA